MSKQGHINFWVNSEIYNHVENTHQFLLLSIVDAIKKMIKKVFITGGAGYVGAVLTPYLLEKGYEVTVLDLMIYGEEVLTKNKNLKIIKGDIRDKNILTKELPGHDVLIHLACISNDPSFELNPELGKSINLDAFTPLVDIAKKSEVKDLYMLHLPQFTELRMNRM